MANSQLCRCGSGEFRFELFDARGISCGYACRACEEKKKSQFRPEIFEDSQYTADEPIDEC